MNVRTIPTLLIGAMTVPLLLSGSAEADLWWPDLPPASPNAKNDEFDDDSLDGKWTVWDPFSVMAASIDTSRKSLELVSGSAIDTYFSGIHQPVPETTEYAIYAKISVRSSTTWTTGGLFVSGDIGSTPYATLRSAEVLWSTNMRWDSRTWTFNFGSNEWDHSAEVSCYQQPASGYVRIRMNGSSCATDFSADGVGWANLSTTTLAYTPTHFGVSISAVSPPSSGGAGVVLVDFVRVFSGTGTSGFDATKIGDLLDED